MKLKLGGKLIIALLVAGGGIFGLNMWLDKSGAGTQVSTSTVAPKVEIGGNLAAVTPAVATAQIALPAANSDYTLRVLQIPWNATIGLHYANGDTVTAPGSLMAQRGVKVSIERQDDYSKILEEQVAFANEVSKGVAKPAKGAPFAVIMGDAYPAYIAGAQEALGKLNQQLQVVGALGYSRGEDKCMLPPEMKADPKLAKGSLIGAVLRDGDWNICVKWASDNDIPVNPNEKTYDPGALNFVSVSAFTEADEKLITGYCEDRKVASAGKLTGQTKKVCVNGTATWTPGDVKVVKQKGGVVSVASTKEYAFQMPAIIIGNRDWMAKNKPLVENFLAAALAGGEAVRSDDAALTKAAGVSAKVYKEEDAAYWKRYFKGVTESDKQGNQVFLGGSTTNGLADNAYLFGLNGNDNIYRRVYTVFGGFTKHYYPEMLPTLIPYDEVVNTAYLSALLSKAPATMPSAEVTNYAMVANKPLQTVSRKSYSIEFETGKTAFTPKAAQTLDDLLNQAAVTGLVLQLNGHTDAVGNPAANLELSKKRADAVKTWIVANSSGTFPAERVRTRGYGDAQPAADNTTAEGRAKNRRVEVLLLSE